MERQPARTEPSSTTNTAPTAATNAGARPAPTRYPDHGAMDASLQRAVRWNSRVAARKPLAPIMTTQPRQCPPRIGETVQRCRRQAVQEDLCRMRRGTRQTITRTIDASCSGTPWQRRWWECWRTFEQVSAVCSSGEDVAHVNASKITRQLCVMWKHVFSPSSVTNNLTLLLCLLLS